MNKNQIFYSVFEIIKIQNDENRYNKKMTN